MKTPRNIQADLDATLVADLIILTSRWAPNGQLFVDMARSREAGRQARMLASPSPDGGMFLLCRSYAVAFAAY